MDKGMVRSEIMLMRPKGVLQIDFRNRTLHRKTILNSEILNVVGRSGWAVQQRRDELHDSLRIGTPDEWKLFLTLTVAK
jgi:hypothetical protein